MSTETPRLSSETQIKAVLITGATGFIGRRLTATLMECPGFAVHVLVRDSTQATRHWPADDVEPRVGDLTKPDTLATACSGVDTIYHLAGYAHANGIAESEVLNLHQRITVEGTHAILTAAVVAGVKRFIFVSSVKAMGEGGVNCLDESSDTQPTSIYGHAKLTAENMVLQTGRDQGMHVCILRLPLVYGHDNKGNLPRMIEAIDRGRFPPLPELGNKRSMVHVDDVVQALLLAAESPSAVGQTYIVTDEQAYSTHTIYSLICSALGRPMPGWTVPVTLLQLVARAGDLVGAVRGRPLSFNSDALDKLIGSAWYSSDKIHRELGYRPTRTLKTSVPEMVAAYRTRQ